MQITCEKVSEGWIATSPNLNVTGHGRNVYEAVGECVMRNADAFNLIVYFPGNAPKEFRPDADK